MESEKIFQIDFDDIVKTKAGKNKIPAFVTKVLRKIVKVDELNSVLRECGSEKGVDLMNGFLKYFDIKVEMIGIENIPKGKRLIFASNHPLGGLDGICLSSVIGNLFDKKIKYLVNDILYFIRPLRNIFVPVNKLGSQSRKGFEMVEEAFASDNQIITFPAGLCSRKRMGKIRDMAWKKTFVSKTIQYHRDIVPVYFEGKNSDSFYNLARIRKFLNIKFNVEMMFLPREMFKKRGTTLKIHFLPALPWQFFDSGKTTKQWAEYVENLIYEYQNKHN